MKDVVFLVLACVALPVLLVAPLLALLAFLRVRRVERELGVLRNELRARREKAGEPPARERSRDADATHAPAARAPAPLAPPAPPPRAAQAPAQASVTHPAEQPPGPRPEPPRAPAAPARIEWERWLGVRGAAVVGGVFLALAAIFFFKHAFSQGWIAPGVRVASGIVAGLAAIHAAARLRQRAFDWAPSALEGAGVVALYASVWAADQRYALISRVVSFPAMAATTALACALALRNGSLFSALLGLAGGFATPLLLAEGGGHTLPLFGYLLVLDLGLLFVARRRGWAVLALGAVAGTFLFEVLTVFVRGERPALSLPILAAFAALFALGGARAARGTPWLAPQALGVLLPFVFALRYAGAVDLGPHLWGTALFLALLVVAEAWVARQHGAPWLASAAALAGVAVAGLWVRGLVPNQAGGVDWELCAVAVAMAAVSHALGEWEQRASAAVRGWRTSAMTASAAWAVLVLGAITAQRLTSFPAYTLALVLLAALLLRQSAQLGFAPAAWCAGLALGAGFGLAQRGYGLGLAFTQPSLPDARLFWLLPLALAAGLLFYLPRAARAFGSSGPQAAGTLLLACGAYVLVGPGAGHAWLLTTVAALFGALLLCVAARLASSAWAAGSVATFVALGGKTWLTLGDSSPEEGSQLLWALVLGSSLVLLLAPFLGQGLAQRRFAWAFLALLAPLLLPCVQAAWEQSYDPALEWPPYVLGGLGPALAAGLLRARGAPHRAVGWLAASAALFASSGVADALDHEELAVSCALFAAALAALARWLALPAASWAAVLAGGAATAVLGIAALEPQHFARSESLLVHWISYDYLLPAAALAGALQRLPPGAHAHTARVRSGVLGGGVLVLLFLWLNLVIENGFARTERLTLLSDGLAGTARYARDLVTSLAWGLFAGVLLVLGTLRRLSILRWTSLGFFVLAIGKVFLHDLGHLDGLYRVASLAGLALSLIGVSLFYQRFVFRRLAPRAGG